MMVGRLDDDLDPVVEFHTANEFWQMIVSVEPSPTFLCALEQLEDHGERGPVGTALRSDGAVAHGGEGAFNGIGKSAGTGMAEAAMALSREYGFSRRQAYRYLELARAARAIFGLMRASTSLQQARSSGGRCQHSWPQSANMVERQQIRRGVQLEFAFDRLRAAKLEQAHDNLVPNRRRREDGGERR